MLTVLIVEDSSTVTKILKHLFAQQADLRAVYAGSLAEARQCIAEATEPFFAAVADLALPDAPDGEVVDYLLQQGLPVIVLTANYQEERRERLLAKGIVDYIVKESRFSYAFALRLIRRLERNRHLKVLVAEDSATTRRHVRNLLEQHLFQVLEAEDGNAALARLAEHPDIRLLITDFHMPEMDGFDLVRAIRHQAGNRDLVIIGLSGEGGGAVSAKFIKNGANDFLAKPFLPEEFHCRVMHNMEEQELLETVRERALRDGLTGLYNRQHFFDHAEPLFAQAAGGRKPLALALMDIDSLGRLNDHYGHRAGDAVLSHVGELLRQSLQRFVLARMSGGEFCALLPGLNNEQAVTVIDRVRELVAREPVELGGQRIAVTLSAGVTSDCRQSLDHQLYLAQQLLRRAKDAGRDITIGDDEEDEATV